MVIQQHSRKLPMMDILMSETCWAHKKWNKIASDIKFVFHSSTIKTYFLYSPTSHKILHYHSSACTGVITTYLSTTMKMATWVAETCRWSLCNKITFINRSTFVVLYNKFTLSFPLTLHFSNKSIALKWCATWYENCAIATKWDISKEHLESV